jgi:hypothetical protein
VAAAPPEPGKPGKLRLRDRFQVFPYGWVRTDVTWLFGHGRGFRGLLARLGAAEKGNLFDDQDRQDRGFRIHVFLG